MAWDLTGNAQTNAANNFLGTTDNSPLVIKTNGVEALRIDTNHNVGIGTTAPGARLTVDAANEGNSALRLMSGPNVFLDITPTHVGGRFQTVLNTLNNRDVAILTGTGTGAGNVGIGTPTPAVRTHLEGTSDPQATLAIRRPDNNKFVRLGVGAVGAALDFDPTSVLVIQTNTGDIGGNLAGKELLRVTPDGHVGIGTPQPVTSLHVAGNLTLDSGDSPVLYTGTGNVEHNRFLTLFNSPGTNSASGLKAGGVLVSGDYAFANPGKNDLVVKGNVGIGTSAPVTALHVIGSLALDPQGNPVIFTGTGSGELHRYLELFNSPGTNSASGLKAGGILVSDDYSLADPGKSDLVVKGNVTVHGDVFLSGGDCAEDFDATDAAAIEPGTVLILTPDGTLGVTAEAYDTRVVGVVSGAGDLKPGLRLDRHPQRNDRVPVAMMGKVFCKVDATYGPIEVGDLLTSSPSSGHAMKVADAAKSSGSVIGKAMRGWNHGRGLIPVLVALQ